MNTPKQEGHGNLFTKALLIGVLGETGWLASLSTGLLTGGTFGISGRMRAERYLSYCMKFC